MPCMKSLNVYVCLCLIMFDVKLTPVVVRWTAYLFVWMGRRRTGLVGLLCLVSCLRIAGASSVYFAFRVLERLWSRTTFILCYVMDFICCWDIPYVGIYYYLDVFPEFDDMATWGVCDIPLWCFYSCWNFMHVYCGSFGHVTSISYLFIIIAWFIAYLEIGCYMLVSEPCRSCPDQNSVWCRCRFSLWDIYKGLRYMLKSSNYKWQENKMHKWKLHKKPKYTLKIMKLKQIKKIKQ